MATEALQIDALLAGLNDPDTTKSYSGAIVATFAADGATPKAVWTNKAKTAPTTVGLYQLTLDSNGQYEAFGDGVYTFKVYASTDTGLSSPLQTWDGLTYLNPTDGFVLGIVSVSALRAGPGGDFDNQLTHLLGYNTEGDGGGQHIFWDAASTDTDNGISIFKATPATGRYKSVDISLLTPLNAGVVGGGSTDDQAALQDFIDLDGVDTISLPNDTYLLGLGIDVPSNKKILLNGSILNFDLSNVTDYGFDVQGDNVEISGGTINVFGAVFTGAGIVGNPITAGVQSTGEGFHDLIFKDLELTTTRADGSGAGIGILGESYNIEIANIYTPDTGILNNLINIEWSGPGVVTGGTLHPHDIVIKNIVTGDITGARAIIWLSATFNIQVTNVYAEECDTAIVLTGGDKTNEFAPLVYKNLIGKGITIDGVSCDIVNEQGIAATGVGSASSEILEHNVLLNNINLKASAANTDVGIDLQTCDGITLTNFIIDGFNSGYQVIGNSKNHSIEKGIIRNSVTFGARIGSSGTNCESPSIKNVTFTGNNTEANVSQLNGAISLRATTDAVIDGCTFGEDGVTETQLFSITSLIGNTLRPRVNNCHTYAVASGGTAYVFGGTSNWEINPIGDNNTSAPGVTLSGGVPLMHISGNGKRTIYYSSNPSVGPWIVGDRVRYPAPAAGGHEGLLCTTAGTYGAATDSTGDTDGSTAVITGMADTSDFTAGDIVNVSAGFASSVVTIISVDSATQITVDENSNAVASNITIDTTDPVWKTWGDITA